MSADSIDIKELLSRRLAEDPAFRTSFLQDPRAALDSLTGLPLPSHITVTATAHDSSITLSFVTDPDVELSEVDLAAVGGGVGTGFDGYRLFWDNNDNHVFDTGDSYIN
jgi:hypothetical protein